MWKSIRIQLAFVGAAIYKCLVKSSSSRPKKKSVSSLALNESAMRKLVWEFYREHFRSIFLCQSAFSFVYFILGKAAFSFWGYIQIPLWILLFIIGILNFISISRVSFLFLEEEPSKKIHTTLCLGKQLFLIAVFFTGVMIRSAIWGLLLIAFPIGSINSDPPILLLLVPVGFIVMPGVAIRTLSRYFMVPLMLLEHKKMTLSEAKRLSISYVKKARKMVGSIIVSKLILLCILPFFLGIWGYVFFDLRLPKVYYYLYMILSNLFVALWMSYVIVSMVLVYRMISSDEFSSENMAHFREN